jgi:hypothetical protein
MTILAQGLEIVTRCFPGTVVEDDHRSAEDAKIVSLVRQLSLFDLVSDAECRAGPFPTKPKAPGGIRRPRPVPSKETIHENLNFSLI